MTRGAFTGFEFISVHCGEKSSALEHLSFVREFSSVGARFATSAWVKRMGFVAVWRAAADCNRGRSTK
jgi:hypothetical protein